jgi:hypothetical protein
MGAPCENVDPLASFLVATSFNQPPSPTTRCPMVAGAAQRVRQICGSLARARRWLQTAVLGVGCIRHALQSPEQRLLDAILRRDWERASRLLRSGQPLRLGAALPCGSAGCLPRGGSRDSSSFHSPVTALGALLSVTESEAEVLPLVGALLDAGAPAEGPQWRDASGRHVPLSKALQRGWYSVAALLQQRGAGPGVLVLTDLLPATRFAWQPVEWLVNAAFGTPEAIEFCNDVIIALVVCRCVLECLDLHLHAGMRRHSKELRQLVTAAEGVVLRLAAAGAPPARESQFHIPQCFVQPLWEPLVAAATRRLEWSHAMHALYPAGARAAVAAAGALPQLAGGSAPGPPPDPPHRAPAHDRPLKCLNCRPFAFPLAFLPS